MSTSTTVKTLADYCSPPSFPNLGLVRFPEVVISPEQRAALGLSAKASNRTVLKKLAWSGYQALSAKGRFQGITEAQVITQFKTEFETFDKTGVHDYLLLIWDVNEWCDRQGIVRGYGRGSAASSLTLYCLGITRVNPIKHNLNFPRFLSEARLKPVIKDGVVWVDGKAAPDIDCDYEFLRRPEVLLYLETKYAGRVSKISTRLELTGKMALKDVLKTYGGRSDEEAQMVSDHIEVRYGKVQTLTEAREQSDGVKEWLAKDPSNEEIYSIAMILEGAPVAHGVHPSGVLISYDPLDGNVPLETSRKGDVLTTYDMETVAGLGIKADILGVRTLDLVAGTAALAGITVDSIDAEDPSIYEYYKGTEAYLGLFQISDGLTKDVVKRVQPKGVDQLGVCLAISRPGALKYIDDYVEYVHTGKIKHVHPAIDAVLQDTANVLVYQEQITQVCHEVFGISLIDADQVRYAVGKKKKEEMAKWEPVLIKGGADHEIPESVTKYFWDVCNASADYLFVKSHSYSYLYLTAATTYLKAKYPLQFYLTMLQLAQWDPKPTEVTQAVIAEMKLGGFSILPPSIIHSESDFSIQGGAIRFGLSSIKGINDGAMAKLGALRSSTTTSSTTASRFQVFEAAKAAKIQINVLVSLIYSGCLDTGLTPRSYYALNAQLYSLLTDREKPIVHKLASQYSDDLIAILKDLPNRKDEKGKPLIKESRLTTIRRDYADYWAMYQQNSGNEELCCYLFEKELLGFSYTSSLHGCYSQKVAHLTPLKDVVALGKVKAKELAAVEVAQASRALPGPGAAPGGDSVAAVTATPPVDKPRERYVKPEPIRVVAFINEIKKHLSKKDATPYLKLVLADDTDTVLCLVHGRERVEAVLGTNGGDLPTEGQIVTVTGDLSRDGKLLFASSFVVQPRPVCFKRSAVEVAV